MKDWVVKFYNQNVEGETFALPKRIVVNLARIMEMMKVHGPNLGRPHTAPLGDGLFEIRAKGTEGIARSLFCTIQNKTIVILLSVIKKSDQLRDRDIELARKRMKGVQSWKK